MKTAFVTTGGEALLVLRPETEGDRVLLDTLSGEVELSTHRESWSGRLDGRPFDFQGGGGELVVVARRTAKPGLRLSEPQPDHCTLVESAVLTAVRSALLDPRCEGRFPVSGGGAVGASALREELATVAAAAVRSVLGTRAAPPDDVDLGKFSDGTWVYRNHAGTWQGCPPPFSPETQFPPDDVNEYYRRTQDGDWQYYDRPARAWGPCEAKTPAGRSRSVDAGVLRSAVMRVEQVVEGFDDERSRRIRAMCREALGATK